MSSNPEKWRADSPDNRKIWRSLFITFHWQFTKLSPYPSRPNTTGLVAHGQWDQNHCLEITRKPRSTAKATVAIKRQIFQVSWPPMLAWLVPPLGAYMGGRLSFHSVIPPDLVASSQSLSQVGKVLWVFNLTRSGTCTLPTFFLLFAKTPTRKCHSVSSWMCFLTLARPWRGRPFFLVGVRLQHGFWDL